jgi:predicted N-acetyltransferase YhbS
MPVSIRPLADTDLKSVEKILSLAFQRSGNWIPDLRLYRKIQPDGYFLAEDDGSPVGMVGAVIYSTYAYVGLMAVHPESQRKGIGLALMQHVLNWLDQQQVPLVLLDASPSGQPLYERLGFVAYDPVEILQRPGGQLACPCPSSVKPLSIRDLDLITAPDIIAFGADRSKVLRLLLDAYPDRAFFLPDANGQVNGYLFAQENRIGPWVMQDGSEAEELLQAALSLPFSGPISVAAPGENAEAIALLQHYGFKFGRANRHMGKGHVAPTGQREKVFGQASLSLG